MLSRRDTATPAVMRRRLECHQCSCLRPANAQRVALEQEDPSPVLKVSGLEPYTRFHSCEWLMRVAASAISRNWSLTAKLDVLMATTGAHKVLRKL